MTLRAWHLVIAVLAALLVNGAMIFAFSQGAAASQRPPGELSAAPPVPLEVRPPPVERRPPPRTKRLRKATRSKPRKAIRTRRPRLRAPALPGAFADPDVAPPALEPALELAAVDEGEGDGAGEAVEAAPEPTLEAGEVDRAPRPQDNMMPRYPPEAEAEGVEGWVRVRLLIDERGRVTRVRVLRAQPPGAFDRAAMAAVRRWRFEPARHRGEQVPVWAEQTLRFELQK